MKLYVNRLKRATFIKFCAIERSTFSPIQPGMNWTVNYGGGGLCVPPVYLDNYATYRYEKLHTNKKNVFFLDKKLNFLCYRFENYYRLKCDPKLTIVHKLIC